jgi:DNA-binding PucR family transcriptional regulator
MQRLIPDLEGLAYFKRWLERKQQIAKPYIIDSKENFLSSPVLQDVEYKTLADYTFEDLAKIQENDQGWRFVNDETGKAIQVVYKKSGDQMILRVGLAIAQPVEQVFDVLMNLNRHTEWNVKFHKGKLVKQISENIDVNICKGSIHLISLFRSYMKFTSHLIPLTNTGISVY